MINEFITWKDHNRTVENKISKKYRIILILILCTVKEMMIF